MDAASPFIDRLYPHKEITGQVVSSAIRVHRELGPGLLESVYRTCLADELAQQGVAFEVEVAIPVIYGTRTLDCGFRADLVVEGKVLVELKSVERLMSIHEAQVLTYLKLMKLRIGLLINFNVTRLGNGIQRLAR